MALIEQKIMLKDGKITLPAELEAWFGKPMFWTYSEADGGVLDLRPLTVELKSILENAVEIDGSYILTYGELTLERDGSFLLPSPCEAWRADRVLISGNTEWRMEIFRDLHALDVPEITEEEIERVIEEWMGTDA